MARKTNAGGARKGAGKPPGGVLANVSHLHPSLPPDDIDHLNLDAKKRTYATIRSVGGMSRTAACRWMGMSPDTGKKWEVANWFKIACETARQKAIGNPIIVFGPLMDKAAEVYNKALDGENIAEARRTAKDVFDRVHGKPVVREHRVSTSAVNITVNFGEGMEEYLEAGYSVLDGNT